MHSEGWVPVYTETLGVREAQSMFPWPRRGEALLNPRGTFQTLNPALTVNQLLNMKLFVNVKIVFQNLTKQCCKSYFHISESFAPMGKTSGPGPGSGKMAQSWEKKKKVSKSKVRQAVCRYCRLSMAAQNYLRHLKISHKDEWESNPGDLKEAGDRAISFFNPVSSSGGAVAASGSSGGVSAASGSGGGASATSVSSGGAGEALGSSGAAASVVGIHSGEEVGEWEDVFDEKEDSSGDECIGGEHSVSDKDVMDDDSSGNEDLHDSLELVQSRSRSPIGRIRGENVQASDEDEESSDQERGRTKSRKMRNDGSCTTADLKLIEAKVDDILKKQNIDYSAFTETSHVQRVAKKLDVIKEGMKVKDVMKEVSNITNNLSKLFVVDEVTENDKETTSEDLFLNCRGIIEIEVKAAEFKYSAGFMECLVCESKFKYGTDQPREFEAGEIQSQKFRDLKKTLKRHLQTGKHSEMLKHAKAAEEVEFKEKNRNKKIARTLGTLIYKNLYTGTAQSLYPVDVAMLKKEGVDVGELNHSRKYSAEFGKSIGEVVQGRVTNFLSSPLVQTGLPPPVKVVADKATHKHWSNNLTGVITIVPGSDQLIQGIFLDAPRCERSTGDALSEDIMETLNKFKVSPCQVTGLAGDGAYAHCSVGKKLDEKLGTSGFHDTDFCHICGRVEINARNLAEFQWITSFVLIVSKTNKLINWGQAWHLFFKVK